MAARQENSSKSLRILMAIGAPYVASSSPSASQDVGQKVMRDWLNLGGGPERELTHGRTINDACPQRPCVADAPPASDKDTPTAPTTGTAFFRRFRFVCRIIEPSLPSTLVMKDSISAAASYVRMRTLAFGI